jgi:sodium/bile acid cotransporter 7
MKNEENKMIGMEESGAAAVTSIRASVEHPSIDTPESKDEPRNSSNANQGVLGFVRWWLEDQWFLVALAILIVIASQAQVPVSQQKLKTTVVSYLCVSVIFLLTGLTLPTRTLIDNYSRWKLHLFVQMQCFLMTSAVMFGVVSACATNPNFMDPGLLVGLLLLGCISTTISSNVVMTKTAHGNVALTVVQSTIGNFLGPFVTPALISMYISTDAWYTDILPKEHGGYEEIYRRVFKQLGLSIFVPLVREPFTWDLTYANKSL